MNLPIDAMTGAGGALTIIVLFQIVMKLINGRRGVQQEDFTGLRQRLASQEASVERLEETVKAGFNRVHERLDLLINKKD